MKRDFEKKRGSLSLSKGHKRYIFLIAFFFICAFCFSQKIHPSIEPVFLPEDVLVNANRAGWSLSANEVFRLALLCSECPLESEDGEKCLLIFEKIKAEVSSDDFMQLELEERGRAVLKLLYRDYLTTYDFHQTRTDVALLTGVYNCVSSGVLYLAAAKAAGLEVRGQKTTEHAFCTVYLPNASGGKTNQLKKIDVETTNPYGFNPGSREAIENEDKIQGYYVVPKKYYANRQEVSDIIFAGLIAGNLCSYYIEKNDYMNSIPLGVARYEAVLLEKNNSKAAGEVRRDLDVLASNYMNHMPEASLDYAKMLDWYIAFIDRFGMTNYIQKNMDSSFYNLMVMFFEERNYELADEYYKKAKPYISQKERSTALEILTDTLVLSLTEGLGAQDQIVILDDLIANGQLEAAQIKRAQLYLENAWLSILNECMNAGAYEEGYKRSGLALQDLPQSSKLKKTQKMFYDNCITNIHNSFARTSNAGDYDGARTILEEGLQKFPDDKTLKSDLVLLNKRTSN